MDTNKQPIFIHIPKTGGTSINCVMKGTEWQTPLNFHYRHLDPDTKVSNAGDIFDRENYNQYQDEYLFMMLRNPIDRLISEYYYIRKNSIFMDMLSPVPMSFLDYVSNHQTANGMLKFLHGLQIYSSNIISNASQVIEAIETLDIHVGIFEQYDRSLSYFKHTGNFTWPEIINVKRATLNRPKLQQISAKEIEIIKQNNKADFMLYEYAKARLLAKSNGIAIEKLKYKGGKLDFVIPYTLWNCILDIELNNRQFILENKKFFISLNIYLHKTVTTGKAYTKGWVKMFKKAVNHYFTGTKFAKEIKKVKRTCTVEEIIAIARLIDKASSDKSMGLELGHPKIKLALTDEMSQVFNQADTISKGNIKW
jgi:hypothetical protein